MPTQVQNRIGDRFRDLKTRNAKGLVVYLTAGDPDLDATAELLQALDRAGVDVIELGVPFSDPLADGPVIQRASERALRSGTTLRKILERFKGWRETVQAPIILFSYFNPILQYGLENFAKRAAEVGVDGALIVDLTADEADEYVRVMRAHHLDTVFLASPTSTDVRLKRAAELSTGFFYLISRTGVTGERAQMSSSGKQLAERTRRFTSLPLAVGFGISTPAQVQEVQSYADAAVVGSAVVHAIEDHYAQGGAQAIEKLVRQLKKRDGGPKRMSDVADWRKRIDEIDRQLVKLLNERAQCAVEIGHLKKKTNSPTWQPQREAEILLNVEKANPGPLDHSAIRRLFERIIDEARSLERHSMENGTSAEKE